MVAITNLKSLIDRLNPLCRRSLENAAGLALSRTHYNVEIEHWLYRLLEESGNDIALLLRQFDVDADRLRQQLETSLGKFQTGNSRAPALAPSVVALARDGWLLASVEFAAPHTRSGHLLCALLKNNTLGWDGMTELGQLHGLSRDALQQALPVVTAKSVEAEAEAPEAAPTPDAGAPAVSPPGAGGALARFTQNLSAQARAGKIDPVLGRDDEIRQMVDILTRRRQNNPILVGEAGVGKTALVEGLALRIAAGDVPGSLATVELHTLDLALLQAGAGIKGEFESRLKAVIDEVKASPRPVILFIDEAHTLIGAGAQAGQGDAANLLKPALARGELRTIAATTWAEYKKYFETDAALTRRFQTVKVDEPDEATTADMLRGLVAILEAHHGVRVLDSALDEAVRLSHRYITGRQLPDKAVSLLDTACARVSLGQSTQPPALEDRTRRLQTLARAMTILERETVTGADHHERLARLRQEQTELEAEQESLRSRWEQEKTLVATLQGLRTELEQAATGDADTGAEHTGKQAQWQRLSAELAALQGEQPLVRPCVDEQSVAQVVAAWTGIPVGRMVSDEIQAVLSLEQRLGERVVGQDHALATIAQSISTSRAGLGDPRRPIGVFLLVGTSGVGKTETAVALAETLYGGEQNMTVINMSEFKEEHKVSLLMGSPPGYVGYREGGVLTEAVRRKPYSVVLLDEMEKAHPEVQDIFYQVFDKGTLRDGEGRDIDFKNTIVLMTSNAGDELIKKHCAIEDTRPGPEALARALHPELLKTFKAAFLGRLTVVPYYPLGDEILRRITLLQLARIARRVADHYQAGFGYDEAVVDAVVSRCQEVDTGARNIDHILSRRLLPGLSAECLGRMARGETIRSVQIGLDAGGDFTFQLNS